MLMLNVSSDRSPARNSAAGFNLVELMVALGLGLIVVLAAVGFVVSIAKANAQNIQVTRLTQELRALSEVMSREIRRSRYVADPVSLVASVGANNRDAIDTTTAGCIVFGYDEPPDPPAAAVTVSRSIRLDGSAILLNPAGTNCTGGSRISSQEIRITNLSFAQPTPSRIEVSVTGTFANPPPGLEGLARTFRQTIYIRSGQVD